MRDYLLVSRQADRSETLALSERLLAEARREGWIVRDLSPRAWLASGPDRALAVTQVSNWSLVGDVLNRRNSDPIAVSSDHPRSYEAKLMRRFWGRYVGFAFEASGRLAAVLRDPSGALEATVWEQDGLAIATSAASSWWLRALCPGWTVSRSQLAAALNEPLHPSAALLFDGVTGILPGSLQAWPLSTSPCSLWSPAEMARESLHAPPPAALAAANLRAALEETVDGLAGLGGPLAMEISGGLDSSIVAACLNDRNTDPPVALWLNAYGAYPEADERSHAARVATHLDVPLTTAPHAVARLTEASLEAAAGGLRPPLSGLDRAHDEDWARRCRAAGAEALFTGKGGDSILLQRADADVFVDQFQIEGWRTLLHRDTAALARFNAKSVWTFLQSAHRRRNALDDLRGSSCIRPAEQAGEAHPWLRDLESFGPAKTLQIAGVADGVMRHGATVLTEAVDVRHPFCAQPVVEACLRLPSWTLTHGGRDRGLARTAFADRLPPLAIDRRTKGDMSRVYGHMVRDSLPFLREWLLDGRLAQLELLDRFELEAQLDPDALRWRGGYGALIQLAAYEAWVRVWERRLDRPAGSRPATPEPDPVGHGCSPGSTNGVPPPNR